MEYIDSNKALDNEMDIKAKKDLALFYDSITYKAFKDNNIKDINYRIIANSIFFYVKFDTVTTVEIINIIVNEFKDMGYDNGIVKFAKRTLTFTYWKKTGVVKNE